MISNALITNTLNYLMKKHPRSLWSHSLVSGILLMFSVVWMRATTTVDVLIVYDTTAKAWVDSNGGMAVFSANAIAKMNQAMQNSGIDCSFRLAYTTNVNYTHSDLSTDLSDLQSGSGNLASSHTLRNTYGADLVAMFVDTGSAYGWVGQGYLLTSLDGQPNNAFTANAIRSVEISHTLTHEVGHNFGCGHAKRQATQPGPGPIYTYAAGWYFTGNNSVDYHTIMAYDYDGKQTYVSAPLFSSPLVSHQGTTTGDAADGDNARCIRNTMAVVAGYRADALSIYTLSIRITGAQGSPLTQLSPKDRNGVDGYFGNADAPYSANQPVDLLAAASSGATVFSTWSGVDSQSGRNAKVFMSKNRTAVAVYVPATAQLGSDLSFNSQAWSDTSGSGDMDDVVEGREDVAVKVGVSSAAAVENVRGVLSSTVGDLSISDPDEYWPDIPASGTAYCEGKFDMFLNRDSYSSLPLTLRIDYDKGGLPYYQYLSFNKTFYLQGSRAARFDIVGFVADDSTAYSTANNGNGIFESGEKARIRPRLRNIGNANASNVSALIYWPGGGGIAAFSDSEQYDDLSAAEEGYPLNGGFYTIRADRGFYGTLGMDFVVEWAESQIPVTNVAGFDLTVASTPWLSATWQAGGVDYSFGVVTPGSRVTNNISIQNSGSATLTISNIVTSAPDITIVGTTFPLNVSPGQVATVSSVFDTTGINASVVRSLTVQSNGRRTTDAGPTNATSLLLSGTVTSATGSEMAILGSILKDYYVTHGAGNCDGDADLDVVLLTSDISGTTTDTPTLFVYEKIGDNQFVERWNSGTLFSGFNVRNTCRAVAVGDVNGDGKDEIAVAIHSTTAGGGYATNGKLFLFENTAPNTWTPTWTGYTANGPLLDVIIADSDNDGRKELILSSMRRVATSNRAALYVIENNGGNSFTEIYSITDLPDGDGGYAKGIGGVTVADSDRDGRNEIIFGLGHPEPGSGSGAGNTGDQLYIYESTANNTFVKKYSGLSYARAGVNPWTWCATAVGDVDRDGFNELVVGEDGEYQVWVWEISGNDSWASNVSTTTFEYRNEVVPYRERTCIVLGNVDSDANNELVVATEAGSGVNLAIFDSFNADSYVQQWSTNFPEDVAMVSIANTDSSGLPRLLVSVRDYGLYILGQQPAPTVDLCVSSGNISATPTPIEGQSTTLTALVGNSMSGVASNVVVRFFAGDPSQGAPQIGSDRVLARIPENVVTNVSVAWTPALEGMATIYVQVDPTNAVREASEINNMASKVFMVGDSDTEPPVISHAYVSEVSGDGDGVIGTDEDARLSLLIADPSGVASVQVWLDGTSRPVSGPLTNPLVTLGRLGQGVHNIEVRAADGDSTPSIRTNYLSFGVVAAERIGLLHANLVVSNGQAQPVNLGTHYLGSAAGDFFVLCNNGQQSLVVSQLTASVGFSATGLGATSIGPSGLTSFIVRPSGTAVGSYTGTVTIVSSDPIAHSFSFPVRARLSADPTFASARRRSDGSSELRIDCGAGWTYLIQGTVYLGANPTDWRSIYLTNAAASQFSLIDYGATNYAQRFYRALGFSATNTVPHPADLNADFSISINEYSAYYSAYAQSKPWPIPPSPIPGSYATNATVIWKTGGIYHADPGLSPPNCWVPGP
jgi:hypothetical protein